MIVTKCRIIVTFVEFLGKIASKRAMSAYCGGVKRLFFSRNKFGRGFLVLLAETSGKIGQIVKPDFVRDFGYGHPFFF